MAGLPQNTTYDKGFDMAPILNTMKAFGGEIRAKKKALDTSKYDNLTNSIQNRPVSQGNNASINKLGTTTTPYGGQTRYESSHPGIDIANKIGTKIPAFSSGKVTEIVGGQVQGGPGYGNYVIVTDPQGNRWRYSHLNQEYVKLGSSINQGQELGEMGNSGQTYSNSGGTGSHLDLRVANAAGKYVNPYDLIKG